MQKIYERKKKAHLKETSWKQVKRHELNHEFKELNPLNFIEYNLDTHTIPAYTFNGDSTIANWTTNTNSDVVIDGNLIINGNIIINDTNGQPIIIPNQLNQPNWEFVGMIPIRQESQESQFIPNYTNNQIIHTSGFVQVVSPET